MGQDSIKGLPTLVVGAGEDIKNDSPALRKSLAEYGLDIKFRWALADAEAKNRFPEGVAVCVLLVDYGDPSTAIKWLRQTARDQRVVFVASQRKPASLARAMALVGIRTAQNGETSAQLPLVDEEELAALERHTAPVEEQKEENMAAIPPVVIRTATAVTQFAPPVQPVQPVMQTAPKNFDEAVADLKVILRTLKGLGVDSVIFTSDGLEISRRQTLKVEV